MDPISPLPARAELIRLWRKALAACDGAVLLAERLRREPPREPVFLLALGKPAAALARGARRALSGRFAGGLVVGAGPRPAPLARLTCLAGAHPLPDARSIAAGHALWRVATSLPASAEPLVLLAGGGSALAVLPAPGLPVAAKLGAHRDLVESGLSIQSMNAVRAHLSRLKGGGLLRALGRRPLRIEVLSDVGAGEIENVASGPCSADRTTFADCLDALAGRPFPAAARRYLEAGARGARPETVKPGDPLLAGVRLHRLAGPLDLRDAAARAARRAGFDVQVRAAPFAGPWESIRDELARWLGGDPPPRPTVFVAVGEAQVALPRGAGPGGRAQHLVLSLLPCLARGAAAVLVGGSDGRDGASPFAGAAADEGTWRRARHLDLGAALRGFDSSRTVAALGSGLPAGVPRTNLTDLFLLARGAARQ